MNKVHSLLLVDDDPVANFIHEDLLTSLEVSDEIRIASNGAEALSLIKEACTTGTCPQLILLDLNMPVMDGFEFIANFKLIESQISHKVKIIILSSSSNALDIQKAKSLDVEDFLVKPLTEKKIMEWISSYFNR